MRRSAFTGNPYFPALRSDPLALSGAFRESLALVPCRSNLEAGVRFAVVEQVTDAIHRVLEQRGGGKDDHPDDWIDERDHLKGGNESGELPDEAEVFERIHGHMSGCKNNGRKILALLNF